MTDHKAFSDVQIKSESKGTVEAVFARIADPERPDAKDIDKDGDVTFPGAFGEQEIVISAYGHASWPQMGNALPVGRGKIFEDGRDAVMQGQFFVNTTHGRDTFETVKALAEVGLGEWSYGFDTLEDDHGVWAGRRAHFLKKQQVTEVSPVLRGAGLTRTTYAKALRDGLDPTVAASLMKDSAVTDWHAAIRPHTTSVVTGQWDPTAAVKSAGDAPTVDQLRSMHAWVDPTADPTTKAAYRFVHHREPGGPANLRALLAGIAVLNGATATGAGIPDGDRKAVYDHLAGHLEDADRHVPALKSQGDTLALHDELVAALVGVSAAIRSAESVDAVRTKAGKQLSHANVEVLGWIDDELRALKQLQSTPEDEAAEQFARFVKFRLQGALK